MLGSEFCYAWKEGEVQLIILLLLLKCNEITVTEGVV